MLSSLHTQQAKCLFNKKVFEAEQSICLKYNFHKIKCINHQLKEAECADPASLVEWYVNYNISNSAFNEPDLDGHMPNN